MDLEEKPERHGEILIIRRSHGGDHDGHHGGGWKIAYADFVTAMMAFFLVMWLVNSANESTRSRVASYFNPIKMTDPAPGGKGLKDINNTKHSESKTNVDTVSSSDKTGDVSENKGAGKTDATQSSAEKVEDQLMHDPYKALDKIASEGSGKPAGRMVEVVTEKTGDPFDPKAWEALREGKKSSDVGEIESEANSTAADVVVKSASQGGASSKVIENASDKISDGKASDGKQEPGTAATDLGTDANMEVAAATLRGTNVDLAGISKDVKLPAAASPSTSDKAASAKTAEEKPADQKDKADIKPADQAQAEATRKEIVDAAVQAGVEDSVNIIVKMTDEGLLIILSDKADHSMFEIGSAAPTPPLVAVVGAIGKILEKDNGKVVIRGHTDSRQYHTLRYDNWQLSTSRAHMASYMLVQGGLEESRIFKIEGYGSTSPLENTDPLAAENRRVEFLLRK